MKLVRSFVWWFRLFSRMYRPGRKRPGLWWGGGR